MSFVRPEDLVAVVAKLQGLGERFALVGGCALPFLVDEAFVAMVRTTMDVDVVVQVSTRVEYSRLEASLRDLGFKHDVRVGAPRCRWLVDDVAVDVLPTSPNAAEFGSPWFEEGLVSPETHTLMGGARVDVLGPAFLFAAKIDAFFSRGERDFYGSRDLEDIVTLMEGCSRLVDTIGAASEQLQIHVSLGLVRLLEAPAFSEVVPYHISPESPPGSAGLVLRVAEEIATRGYV